MTNVPPGEYEIIAWHEGWRLLGKTASVDVLTQRKVMRPIFSDPKTFEKKVTVIRNDHQRVNFVLSEK